MEDNKELKNSEELENNFDDGKTLGEASVDYYNKVTRRENQKDFEREM